MKYVYLFLSCKSLHIQYSKIMEDWVKEEVLWIIIVKLFKIKYTLVISILIKYIVQVILFWIDLLNYHCLFKFCLGLGNGYRILVKYLKNIK